MVKKMLLVTRRGIILYNNTPKWNILIFRIANVFLKLCLINVNKKKFMFNYVWQKLIYNSPKKMIYNELIL